MQEKDITTISATSTYYPQEFQELIKKCYQFTASGNLDLLKRKPRVGIVGSRKITSYGRDVTRDLARAAARSGVTVVSGLAYGVDSAAHQAALEVGGNTLAVLPSSLRKIYPASHAPLANEIIRKGGLLISEYARELWPLRHYFIERNRLIAALSDVIVVVEASSKSGTSHTVQSGYALGRTIAVVPGNITNPQSTGTNELIRDGGNEVHPITCVGDLLSLLGVNENLMNIQQRAENTYERSIINALISEQLSSEALIKASKLDVVTFNVHLTMLEIKGIIEQTSNNNWRLSPTSKAGGLQNENKPSSLSTRTN